MHRDHRATARKYDAIAPRYSQRYADGDAIASRQLSAVASWGPPPPFGGSILEIGCADGLVTERLCKAGFKVTAVDISPAMVQVAQERLNAQGLSAEFIVADVETFVPPREYDVVLAWMWTFFAYVDDPGAVLRRLARASRLKILVDVNPRTHPRKRALESLSTVGFEAVEWTPVFLPQTRRLRRPGATLLRALEFVPGLRSLILRFRFAVAVMGAKRSAEIA